MQQSHLTQQVIMCCTLRKEKVTFLAAAAAAAAAVTSSCLCDEIFSATTAVSPFFFDVEIQRPKAAGRR